MTVKIPPDDLPDRLSEEEFDKRFGLGKWYRNPDWKPPQSARRNRMETPPEPGPDEPQ